MKTYDIVITGGGVIGASIAYYLTKKTKLSVAIFDIKKPGNASRAAAGGLWPIGESVGLGCGVILFKTLINANAAKKDEKKSNNTQRPEQLPKCFFDLCLKSNELYPALWEEMKEKFKVDFKLEKTGLKYIIYDEYDRKYAQQIADSIPHLKSQLQWYDKSELKIDEPLVSDEAIAALEFKKDDQVNPYLLLKAYREAARCQGAVVYHNTEVNDVQVKNYKVQSVLTSSGTYGCGLLINAAGAWASSIAEKVTYMKLPVIPVKGQVVLSEKMPKIMRSCISTSDCYIAQKDNGELYIGSTTEEKGYDTSCSYNAIYDLCKGAIRCLPMLKKVNIKRTWAGLRPGTPDELPILGPIDGIDGYLNACGHFRTGILTSAITGEIICDLVTGVKPSIDISPFLYSRFKELTATNGRKTASGSY